MTLPTANEAPEGQAPDPDAAGSHSGRLLVRMPKSLHAEVSRAAEREGASLNAYIIGVLSASIAWRQPDGRPRPDAPPDAPAPVRTRSTRALSLALTANLVVLAVAAAIAIALLITAWQS